MAWTLPDRIGARQATGDQTVGVPSAPGSADSASSGRARWARVTQESQVRVERRAELKVPSRRDDQRVPDGDLDGLACCPGGQRQTRPRPPVTCQISSIER